jgi:hypothetical protein
MVRCVAAIDSPTAIAKIPSHLGFHQNTALGCLRGHSMLFLRYL